MAATNHKPLMWEDSDEIVTVVSAAAHTRGEIFVVVQCCPLHEESRLLFDTNFSCG